MANTLTTVGNLVEEVADLLRHDNLDIRINTWIISAYNDVLHRVASPLFSSRVLQATASGEETDLTIPEGGQVSTPVLGVFLQASTGSIFCPKFVTPIDFNRLAHTQSGTAQPQWYEPLAYTLAPTLSDTIGRVRLLVYPKPAVSYHVTLIFPHKHLYNDSPLMPADSTGFLNIPYHFEHVLVWGAAAFGAKVLRRELYPLYKAEYEKALQNMTWIMYYKPDLIPRLRSAAGPYYDTYKVQNAPRIPDTIS